jgi:hypothetical protein
MIFTSRHRAALVAGIVMVWTGAILPAGEPGREFDATAVMRTTTDTRRMPVKLVANRFTSVEQARQLAGVLEQGGQGALLAALTGRADGQLRLGALELQVALVVAEEKGRGYRYLFLTPRRIRVEETTFGEESLDYPFGIAVLEVDGFGRGSGSVHVAAALAIDADGHIEIEDFDGADGRLEDLRTVR